MININTIVMNIAYDLLGCSFLLQPWALDHGRVKDRGFQQLASQLLDFSILQSCFGVLKKLTFLVMNLSDFAPRRPGALLGSSGASRHWLPQAPATALKL